MASRGNISKFSSRFASGTNRERERERESFCLRQKPLFSRTGIPIGNLTSQLFANIYLNELDKFIKRQLHIKYYVRYCDDFVILSRTYFELNDLIPQIQDFIGSKLKLRLHENKVLIRTPRQGIDFLGYVVLPHYRKVRTKTKNRMLKKLKLRADLFKGGQISEKSLNQSLNSYLGVLSHANCYALGRELKNQLWFWIKG